MNPHQQTSRYWVSDVLHGPLPVLSSYYDCPVHYDTHAIDTPIAFWLVVQPLRSARNDLFLAFLVEYRSSRIMTIESMAYVVSQNPRIGPGRSPRTLGGAKFTLP